MKRQIAATMGLAFLGTSFMAWVNSWYFRIRDDPQEAQRHASGFRMSKTQTITQSPAVMMESKR
jgi:hypothetical protein